MNPQTSTPPSDLFDFDDSFVREVPELSIPWQADQVSKPAFIEFNRDLAEELGIDSDALHSPDGLALLSGGTVPDGVTPVAMAYAGHQFGGFSPRLGDGRALLLGEVIDANGLRRDIHLKGSGRTPFARGGDGRAAIGPMLREYLIAEALQALGIPTTRALAVVSTGESIMRDRGPEPGAILTRVAASHLRVGTFEYAARLEDPSALVRLADHAIERHHPAAAAADTPYLALLDAVVAAQAALIAEWMLVGFIHGVMNTDNMTISGEGIDYGPCAFMDRYDPMTVFSSIDRDGRYAYGNQPGIAQWNLARLAETLLPLIDDDADSSIAAATEVLQTFPQRYRSQWEQGMSAKLGLPETDGTLAVAFLDLLAELGADYTTSFRDLARSLRQAPVSSGSLTADPAAGTWIDRWRSRVTEGGHDPLETAARMDRVNPIYIPRNHLVQAALDVATAEGDLAPFDELFDVLTDPYEERDGLERFAAPAPDEFDLGFKTFCGT